MKKKSRRRRRRSHKRVPAASCVIVYQGDDARWPCAACACFQERGVLELNRGGRRKGACVAAGGGLRVSCRGDASCVGGDIRQNIGVSSRGASVRGAARRDGAPKCSASAHRPGGEQARVGRGTPRGAKACSWAHPPRRGARHQFSRPRRRAARSADSPRCQDAVRPSPACSLSGVCLAKRAGRGGCDDGSES